MAVRTLLWALVGGLWGCSSGPAVDRGEDLVWSVERGADLEVVARIGGTEHRLTQRPGSDFAGPVAPDGNAVLILHSNDQEEGHQERLWAHSLPGRSTAAARPLAVSAPAGKVRNPRWAPDGSVVYESDVASFRDLYQARPGAEPVRLTRSPQGCFEPTVGGGKVVHVCSGSDPELWVVPLGGGVHRPLLQRKGEDVSPEFSPDGAVVAFLGGGDGRLALWTVGQDGEGAAERWRPALASERVVAEQGLRWSPEGKRIAVVVRDADGKPGVRVVDLERGETVVRVAGELPRWSAAGALVWTHDDGAGSGVFRLDDQQGAVRLTEVGAWLGWPLGAAGP